MGRLQRHPPLVTKTSSDRPPQSNPLRSHCLPGGHVLQLPPHVPPRRKLGPPGGDPSPGTERSVLAASSPGAAQIRGGSKTAGVLWAHGSHEPGVLNSSWRSWPKWEDGETVAFSSSLAPPHKYFIGVHLHLERKKIRNCRIGDLTSFFTMSVFSPWNRDLDAVGQTFKRKRNGPPWCPADHAEDVLEALAGTEKGGK